MTPLIYSSYSANYNLAKFSIDKGADIETKNNDGLTALMSASRYGNLEIVKLLVESGADINNAKDNIGNTALTYASYFGRLEVVIYLVENGADVNAKDEYGETALDKASTKEVKELLRKAGAK